MSDSSTTVMDRLQHRVIQMTMDIYAATNEATELIRQDKAYWTVDRPDFMKEADKIMGLLRENLWGDEDDYIRVIEGILKPDDPALPIIVEETRRKPWPFQPLAVVRLADLGLPVILTGNATGYYWLPEAKRWEEVDTAWDIRHYDEAQDGDVELILSHLDTLINLGE